MTVLVEHLPELQVTTLVLVTISVNEGFGFCELVKLDAEPDGIDAEPEVIEAEGMEAEGKETEPDGIEADGIEPDGAEPEDEAVEPEPVSSHGTVVV